MFYGAKSFNQDISKWDVSNVTVMVRMFSWAKSFNQDISKWDVSNVTDMEDMFSWAESFNQDIGNWDVSNVTDMSNMFRFARLFDQDISMWDNVNAIKENFMDRAGDHVYLKEKDNTSIKFNNETLRTAIFDFMKNPEEATTNNGHISSWDVSMVTDMSRLFHDLKLLGHHEAHSFNEDISKWDVSMVTDMSFLFHEAESFNQDISNWDVSNVIHMGWMFYNAKSFNQDVSNWDVSNVTNMTEMFFKAKSFNKDFSNWKCLGKSKIKGFGDVNDEDNEEISGCIINVDIEGYLYTHGDGESEFGAYELSISFGDGDGKYEILEKIREELNCDHIILTNVENDNGVYEYYRIIDLPKIWEAEFGSGHTTIESNFTSDEDVIDFVKNLKTISYKKLNPNNEKEIELGYHKLKTITDR